MQGVAHAWRQAPTCSGLARLTSSATPSTFRGRGLRPTLLPELLELLLGQSGLLLRSKLPRSLLGSTSGAGKLPAPPPSLGSGRGRLVGRAPTSASCCGLLVGPGRAGAGPALWRGCKEGRGAEKVPAHLAVTPARAAMDTLWVLVQWQAKTRGWVWTEKKRRTNEDSQAGLCRQANGCNHGVVRMWAREEHGASGSSRGSQHSAQCTLSKPAPADLAQQLAGSDAM